MLLFSILISGSFSFGKMIAGDIHPGALTAVRFVLAGVLLGAGLAVTGRLKREHYAQPWRFAVLGSLFTSYFVLMFFALRHATPVSTAAVFTMLPFLTAVLDYVLFRRHSPVLVWTALVIGAAGSLWVVFRGSIADMLAFNIGKGELIYFVGTLAHAAYAVLLPRLRRGEPVYATTLGITVAGSVILVVVFRGQIVSTDWASLGLFIWATILYLTLLASLSTFSLLAFAATRLPGAKVTAYTYLAPFWVVVLEGAIGHGVPPLLVLAGGVPIMFALVVLFFERS